MATSIRCVCQVCSADYIVTFRNKNGMGHPEHCVNCGTLASFDMFNINDGGTDIMTKQLGFKRLSDDATIPTRAHSTDSGFDLYAAEDVVIHPRDTKVVKTDIAIQLPEGMEAQVRPRSGITSVGFVQVHLGTIDNSYRGNIGIIVENKKFHGYETANNRVPLNVKGGLIQNDDGSLYKTDDKIFSGTCLVRKGDKIAQLVVQHLPQVEAVEVDTLDETDRGEGGFGSTGTSWEDNVNPPTIDELITLGESVSGSTKEDD